MEKRRKVSVAVTALALLALSSVVASAASAAKAPPTVIKVLTIGYPNNTTTDPATGLTEPGIQTLQSEFNKANPSISLQIINIPWGTGSTSYSLKTDAMIKTNAACIYEMPNALTYGRDGDLVNLNTLIAKDPHFKNVWGSALKYNESWGPKNPHSLFYLPDNTGIRVINWDAKLFKDYKVPPLSTHPTLAEIARDAAKMTGKDPVTGQQTYGYWYQGEYAVWQFMAIGDAMGAKWGRVNSNGTLKINWNTPKYLKALDYFVKLSKYAPKGALASDTMPNGFMTNQNVVAIIPEGEQDYIIPPLTANPSLGNRFRTSYNLKGPNGHGGLNAVSPMSIASSCPDKQAAWTALKWLAGSKQAEKFYFDSDGRLPAITNDKSLLPTLSKVKDIGAILGQVQQADAPYPWASDTPRFALQTALQGALAGTLTPKQALQQAQKKTVQWLHQQKPS